MTFKDKLKSYNFWISLVSAIILFLQILGNKLNFQIDPSLIIDFSTALCSIFVILGIVSIPKSKNTNSNNIQDNTTFNQISTDIKETISNILSSSNNLSEKISESFQTLKNNIFDILNTSTKEEDNKNLNEKTEECDTINIEQNDNSQTFEEEKPKREEEKQTLNLSTQIEVNSEISNSFKN